MKTWKCLIFSAFSILLMGSQCNDKNNIFKKKECVLKGRIMQNCTIPGANIELTLKPNAMYADIIYSTTDENGYFEIKYTAEAQSYRLYAPYEIMSGIPAEEYLDLGEINTGGTVNFVIKLQVNNNYTENDTLFYSNWSYPNPTDLALKLAGPFQNGIIDTAINVPFTKVYIYNQSPQLNMTYYVNNVADNTVYFDVFPCNSNFGEVTFVIN